MWAWLRLPVVLCLALGGLVLGARSADAAPPDTPSPQPKVVDSPRDVRLVYSANLVLDVPEVPATLSRIEEVAQSEGGYVASRTDTTIVVRVPRTKFQGAVKEIAGVGSVVQRELQAKDANLLMVDVDVRLKNARAVRERFAQLLHSATSTKEVLDIEKELARVAKEIEGLEATPRVVEDSWAFATVTVTTGQQARAPCDPAFAYDQAGLKHFKPECI